MYKPNPKPQLRSDWAHAGQVCLEGHHISLIRYGFSLKIQSRKKLNHLIWRRLCNPHFSHYHDWPDLINTFGISHTHKSQLYIWCPLAIKIRVTNVTSGIIEQADSAVVPTLTGTSFVLWNATTVYRKMLHNHSCFRVGRISFYI